MNKQCKMLYVRRFLFYPINDTVKPHRAMLNRPIFLWRPDNTELYNKIICTYYLYIRINKITKKCFNRPTDFY